MKLLLDRTLTYSLLSAALATAFWAGSAAAESDQLDAANASVTSALQALKQAPVRGDASKFEAHRSKAVTLLTRAQGEILKAKRLESQK